jgi:hypothetical protein
MYDTIPIPAGTTTHAHFASKGAQFRIDLVPQVGLDGVIRGVPAPAFRLQICLRYYSGRSGTIC